VLSPYHQSPLGQPFVELTGEHVRVTAPAAVFLIVNAAPLGSAVAVTS
jgi:hypothetical protein